VVIRRLANALKMLHQQKAPITVLDDAKRAEEILKKSEEITRRGAYTIPSWAIIKVLREKAVAK
jgi:hypothetical protein